MPSILTMSIVKLYKIDCVNYENQTWGKNQHRLFCNFLCWVYKFTVLIVSDIWILDTISNDGWKDKVFQLNILMNKKLGSRSFQGKGLPCQKTKALENDRAPSFLDWHTFIKNKLLLPSGLTHLMGTRSSSASTDG